MKSSSSIPVVHLFLSCLGALIVGALVGWFGLLGAAVVLGVGVTIWLLRKPMVLIPLLMMATVLGQAGRVPPGTSGSSVLIGDALAVLVLGLAVMYWLSRPNLRPSLLSTKAGIAWTGLLLVAIITWALTPLALSNLEMLTDGLYWLRLVAISSVAWIIASLSQSASLSKRLLTGFFWMVAAVVVIGFIQLYIFPDIRILNKYGWDPHVGRLVSTFLDPNYLGGFFAIGLSVLGAYIFVYRPKTILPWLGIAAILLATLLTYSRSGYIAVVVVVLLLGLRFSWKLLVLAVAVSVPIGLSIPRVQQRIVGGFSVDATSQDRIQSWQHALDIADTYQPLGLGYNHYRAAQEDVGILDVDSNGRSGSGSDSTLLNILTTMGPIGIFLFILILIFVTSDALRASKGGEATPRRVVGVALCALIPALFLHAFFVNAFVFPFVLLPLCILIGILYRPDAQNS